MTQSGLSLIVCPLFSKPSIIYDITAVGRAWNLLKLTEASRTDNVMWMRIRVGLLSHGYLIEAALSVAPTLTSRSSIQNRLKNTLFSGSEAMLYLNFRLRVLTEPKYASKKACDTLHSA